MTKNVFPAGFNCSPELVAPLVAYLASKENKKRTGRVYEIGGGFIH